jgi:hypothetical protein
MGAYSVAGQLHEQGLRARLGRAPRLLVAFAVVAVVAVAGVAAGLLFAGGAADSQTRLLPPVPASGSPDAPYRSRYEGAVSHMTRLNHLLEQRQTELFYASRRGDRAEDVADLRRRVDALERSYADAIAAMGQATR